MVRYRQRASLLEIGNFRVSPTLPMIVGVGLIVLFFAISTIVAFDLKRLIIPDETWHIVVSELFATTWGIPPDTPDTYSLGIITQKPFLYHWINGRLLNLLNLIFPEAENYKILVTFRLAGVFYSTLAVVYCYLLSKEVIKNPWWQLMPVFLLTCTLMFVLLSSGVNYDSLTNLCAFAGIYYFVKLLNGGAFYRNTILWLVWLLAGTITKLTVLPLLAILSVLWVLYVFLNRHTIEFKIVFDWKMILLLVILAVLVILNFLIFGVNIIKYQAVIPSCEMILSENECNQNLIFRRDKSAEDNLSFAQMFNGNATDPFTWLDGWWFPSIIKMTFGFMGNQMYVPSELMITLYRWWFLGMLFLTVRYWNKPGLPVLGLTAIVGFYILTLLQTNLAAELKSGFKHFGIQGRYIFPVFGGLYVLFIYFAEKISNRIASGAVAAATIALFFFNSPIWILNNPTMVPYPSNPIIPEEASVLLVDGSEVVQDFKSDCSGDITQMDVLFGTEQSPSTSLVKMVVIDAVNRQVVAEQETMSVPGENQVWLAFPLNTLQNTKDQPLRIALSADGVQEDAPLKLWNSTTNVYLFGDAVIDGVPTNKDLVFRYTCKRPILKDWFNE